MAEANINLPDKTSIAIKGSPEEISKILEIYNKKTGHDKEREKNKSHHSREGSLVKIRKLIDDNFLKEGKSVIEIKNKLAQMGFNYENADISTTLIRLVKKGILNREIKNKKWLYFK